MRFRLLALSLLGLSVAACGLGADAGMKREERLIQAAKTGDLDSIRALLDAGVGVEAKNPGDGWTPLMWAAVRDQAPAVKLLIARGANREARDRKGLTALQAASRWGRKDGVGALIDAGARVGAVDDNGWSALMWAAFKGQTDMAALLLDRGADLEARDPEGMSPLMRAAMKGQDRTVTLLLARGARGGARSNDGETAADLAQRGGYADLARKLGAPAGK